MEPLEEEYGGTREDERGQGLMEYALALVLVAVAIVAILAVLGPQIANLYSRVTTAIP